MEDFNRYKDLTNEQLADQLDTLVGNTTLLKEASARLRATTTFEVELDGMIEASEEFLHDDTYTTPDHSVADNKEVLDMLLRVDHNRDRLEDLLALERVSKLYADIFKPQED